MKLAALVLLLSTAAAHAVHPEVTFESGREIVSLAEECTEVPGGVWSSSPKNAHFTMKVAYLTFASLSRHTEAPSYGALGIYKSGSGNMQVRMQDEKSADFWPTPAKADAPEYPEGRSAKDTCNEYLKDLRQALAHKQQYVEQAVTTPAQ